MKTTDPFAEMRELIQKVEPLHPDLLPYVEPEGPIGPMLRHPLVFQVPLFENLYALTNRQYEQKKKCVEEALKEGDYRGHIWLHERPYRLNAFMYWGHLPDAEWWATLGAIWVDSENIWQNKARWRRYLLSKRPCRESMMDEEERAALAALPDEIEVFRGCQLLNKKGWSWTTDALVAAKFARRLTPAGRKAFMIEGRVSKKHVLAHFLGRAEAEIVVESKHVEVTKERAV